jgi:quinoprotein glucose dehydrogenase
MREEALRLTQKYKLGPVFSPPILSNADGPLALLTLGTNLGGTNWAGGSYDPENHLLFVSSCSSCLIPIGLVAAPKEVSDMGYLSGTAGQPAVARKTGTGAGEGADALTAAAHGGQGVPARRTRIPLTIEGLPLIKPPYGRLTAIDLNQGEIKWQIPFGPTPDAVHYSPALKGIQIPPTGEGGLSVGSLVTSTLLIVGDGEVGVSPSGSHGARLHAYDKLSGKEVGAVSLPAPQSGSPMTYMLGGKQYIVVAVSGGAYSGEYLAFTLPSE